MGRSIEQLNEEFEGLFYVSPKNGEAMSVGAALSFGLVNRHQEEGMVWMEGIKFPEAAAIETGLLGVAAAAYLRGLEQCYSPPSGTISAGEAYRAPPEVPPEEQFLDGLREFLRGNLDKATMTKLLIQVIQRNTLTN